MVNNIKLTVDKSNIHFIKGRGTVCVLDNCYSSDFRLGDTVEINGTDYNIIGIEAIGQLKGVGLNVVKCKN